MKKRQFSKRWIILGVIVIVLVVLALIFVFYEKDCTGDVECFNRAFSSCSKAKFELIKGGNLYSYQIRGGLISDCTIDITLVRMAAGSDANLVERFEGKSMRCKLPSTEISGKSFEEMTDLADYCTGPLKEEMYKMIIERMYAYLIENLGTISEEFEKGIVSEVV